MSGSLKAFRYFTDAGDLYAIQADESNVEGVHITPPDVTSANESDTPYTVPRNVTPRFARYKSTTTEHVRKVPIMSPSIFGELKAKDYTNANRTFTENVGGTVLTFALENLTAERIRVVKADDTGLNDGDAT